MNCVVIRGSVGRPECSCGEVPLAWARAVGVNRSQRKVFTSGASPGPGAVTMLSRPEPASTMPVARVTPDCEPGYGVNAENTSGALPGSPGSVEENTLTCDSMPGPAPTMMLSANA